MEFELTNKVKFTLFMELEKGSIIMIRDVLGVEINEHSNILNVYVERDDKERRYSFPMEDIAWYEEKTSNFVEIKKKGGDA